MGVITKRSEFMVFFDVKNGNPNGDPAADNRPRQCPFSQKGLVTDVCIKRWIRDYVISRYPYIKGREIFVQKGAILDALISQPYEDDPEVKAAYEAKKNKEKIDVEALAQKILVGRFLDIRWFGGVLTTGDAESEDSSEETDTDTKKKSKSSKKAPRKTAGTVTGPVQITMAESIDPILVDTLSITRCCVTNEKDESKERTMGTKHRIPYALYVAKGFITVGDAEKSGFSDSDLELLKEAVGNMLDSKHSAARGEMYVRKVVWFTHDLKNGSAKAEKLFDAVEAQKKPGVTIPLSFKDYTISIDKSAIPSSVKMEELV